MCYEKLVQVFRSMIKDLFLTTSMYQFGCQEIKINILYFPYTNCDLYGANEDIILKKFIWLIYHLLHL